MNTDKFYELHLDDKFEILETKGVHHKFLVRCKKCNKEHWHDDGILRKPNVKVMYCPYCKNTNFVSKAKQHTNELVEQIVSMYSSGKEQKEITETIGRDYAFVRYWLKKRGLYDPARRVHNTEFARAQVRGRRTQSREAENRVRQQIESLGFEYVGGYTSRNERVSLRCKECGEAFERVARSVRCGIRCPACQLRKRKEQQAIKEARTIARRQAFIEREQRRRKEIEERERYWKEERICKECGQAFTLLSYCASKGISTNCNTAFCSDSCRKENKRKLNRQYRKENKLHGKHIRRAKKYGVEYDPSITLDKLIKRDGLNCSICGLMCIYSGDSNSDLYPSIDHIVPLSGGGGHVWENVQVAHRICNTIKNNHVGREWNNAPFVPSPC